MNVNDILNKALKLLGITDVTVAQGNTDPRLLTLVNALGVTYMQLVTEYAPIEKEAVVTVVNGTYALSALGETVFDVVRLKNDSGEEVRCRLRGNTLYAEEDGRLRLTYYAIPSSYPAIGGSVTVREQITADLLARGVAAEYAMESMMYEEALLHDRKYKEGLRNVLSPHRSVRVDCKRWI